MLAGLRTALNCVERFRLNLKKKYLVKSQNNLSLIHGLLDCGIRYLLAHLHINRIVIAAHGNGQYYPLREIGIYAYSACQYATFT